MFVWKKGDEMIYTKLKGEGRIVKEVLKFHGSIFSFKLIALYLRACITVFNVDSMLD